jgi:hypothetical protein
LTAILEFFLLQRPADSFLVWPIVSLEVGCPWILRPRIFPLRSDLPLPESLSKKNLHSQRLFLSW